jgi:hypothetical protein
MILQGTYNNGVITLKGTKLPRVKAEVEVVIKDKPWQKRLDKIKIKGKSLSRTLIDARYE